jgi:uncharacterized membrane protein
LKDVAQGGEKRALLFHEGFEFSLIAKGVGAALELLGGLLLWLIPPAAVTAFIHDFARRELLERPHDFIARLILNLGMGYSVGTEHFAVAYLLSHGIAKIILVVLLWSKKLWAYPLGVFSLLLFIAYQMQRWTHTHSIFLLLLSVFDAFMVWLTLVEFRRVRTGNKLESLEPPAG